MTHLPASSTDPFSQQALDHIFRRQPQHSDRLASRENSSLEFKQSFNWAGRAKYARSCAAFANARGGYLVFGIANRPHLLTGLSGQAFDDHDPATTTHYLNEHFAPEIRWDHTTHDLLGKHFALLHVHEALDKPVICTRSDSQDEIKESEIYYRYGARTQAIRYPELRAVLQQVRHRDQRLWREHIERIAHIGVRDAAVLDLASGSGTGPGGMFVIDDALLEKLKFIREGEFDERKGAPTIRIVGEARTMPPGIVQPTRTVEKPISIGTPDIIAAFLDDRQVSNPEDYLTRAAFESHEFLPIYYFIRQANLTRSQARELLSKTKSTSNAKRKLIQRLDSTDQLRMEIPSSSSHPRYCFRQAILQQSIPPILSDQDLQYALEAVRTLRKRQVSAVFLRPLLRSWFDKHYGDPAKPALAAELRRAICFIDRAINRSLTSE